MAPSTPISTAMVLAAGLGMRMRPLTLERPKPLVVLRGRTLLDRALDRVRAAGVTRTVVNTHYLAEMIEDHLSDHADIVLSPEAERLETGGGVARALPHLGDQPFFVINSDAVWHDGDVPALNRLAAAWDPARMDVLLLMQPVDRAMGYHGAGDYHLAADGALRRRGQDETAVHLFAGVQILHPKIFHDIPDGPFSLNLLYDRAETAGRLCGLEHDSDWFHVGTPEDLAATDAAFARLAGPSGSSGSGE